TVNEPSTSSSHFGAKIKESVSESSNSVEIMDIKGLLSCLLSSMRISWPFNASRRSSANLSRAILAESICIIFTTSCLYYIRTKPFEPYTPYNYFRKNGRREFVQEG